MELYFCLLRTRVVDGINDSLVLYPPSSARANLSNALLLPRRPPTPHRPPSSCQSTSLRRRTVAMSLTISAQLSVSEPPHHLRVGSAPLRRIGFDCYGVI